MPAPPFLLQDLSPEQRLRVLALDYVTATGFVPPDQWIPAAHAIEVYLKAGVVNRNDAAIHPFPQPVQ